jgi:hypothetical protein
MWVENQFPSTPDIKKLASTNFVEIFGGKKFKIVD